MVCLIFYIAIIINRKNSAFEKKVNVHTCEEPPSPCSFLFAFQSPPPVPSSTNEMTPIRAFLRVVKQPKRPKNKACLK